MAKEPTQRVTVQSGVTVYHGPQPHPFREGDTLDLPASHVEGMETAGHVKREATQQAAAEPAAARSADPAAEHA